MTQAAPEVLVGDHEPDETPEQDAPAGKQIAGRSPTQIALSRLRKDKVFVVCAVIVAVVIVASVFADVINNLLGITHEPGGPLAVPPSEALDPYNYPVPPYDGFTLAHPLGVAPKTATDNLATMLVGLRNSLLVATIATVATTLIGLTVGLMAGFSRGMLDRILSFVIDLFLSFPFILFALAVAPIITQRFAADAEQLERAQLLSLIIVLSTLSWMGLARLVRGQVLQLREREFVLAAQVLGASTRRILFKELLPNLVATLVVVLSMSIPAFIAAEVGLSFLGLGLNNSMGQLIQSATAYYATYPIYLWIPVGVLVTVVLCLNLMGDSIRDAFDPKTRR